MQQTKPPPHRGQRSPVCVASSSPPAFSRGPDARGPSQRGPPSLATEGPFASANSYPFGRLSITRLALPSERGRAPGSQTVTWDETPITLLM